MILNTAKAGVNAIGLHLSKLGCVNIFVGDNSKKPDDQTDTVTIKLKQERI